MNDETKQWTWNDGWILMSIYLAQAKGDCTLANVIAAADATNHAIPTANELNQALTKLVDAGLLTTENNNFIINSVYLDEIENAYNAKGGLFKTANKGQNWLNNSTLKIKKIEKVIYVTQEELKIAYNVYTSNIKTKG